MRYISTRGGGEPKRFSEILLEGLAADGGLYVPEEYPQISTDELQAMRSMSYPELAFAILSKFIDDIPSDDLRRIVSDTYTKENFGSDEVVPIKKLEADLFLLDLCQGPTLAFKDIALQFIGRLFEYALEKSGESMNILGATSGDTGSAAEYALRGRKGITVFMLSPLGRTSEFQRRQMFTLQEANIFNIAVKGTFDDCQDLVKEINNDAAFKKRYKLGAVNSINWARVAAQVVYYFCGYFRATSSNDENVSFAVPTGNFGNILAGYIAKRMGLPVHKLVLATNENNVLEEFFQTGRYRPRPSAEVHATSSPSMDISKASNFERYIFDIVGRDPERMEDLLHLLKTKGEFRLTQRERERTTDFVAGSSVHADRIAAIKNIHERYDVLIDPHTADGVHVALAFREARVPTICLETAKPAKFAETIREAIDAEPPMPSGLSAIRTLPERFEAIERDVEQLKHYVKCHAG